MTEHTRTPWAMECVSDACRVTIGKGRQKWILARLATKQIPETEVAANAEFIVRACNNFDALLEACKIALECAETGNPNGWRNLLATVIRNAEAKP